MTGMVDDSINSGAFLRKFEKMQTQKAVFRPFRSFDFYEIVCCSNTYVFCSMSIDIHKPKKILCRNILPKKCIEKHN